MSRKSKSPIRTLPMAGADVEPNQRDVIIRKLKEDVIVGRGKQKEFVIMQNYLMNMYDKVKELQIQKSRTDVQSKGQMEFAHKKVAEEKRQLQKTKNELRACMNQLEQIDGQQAQLKRIIAGKNAQVGSLKKQALCLDSQNNQSINDMYRIKAEQEATYEQLNRFKVTRMDKQDRQRQINNKIGEVKVYIQQLKEENNELKGKLKTYQFQNNGINENIGQRDTNIDTLQNNFREKHEQLNALVENYIELSHANEKYKKQTQHRQNLLRNENEKNKELTTLYKKSEVLSGERNNSLRETNEECHQIVGANRQIGDNNDKLKIDLLRCQEHLENVMKQNVMIQKEMEKYLREDDQVISVIRRKQLMPSLDNMKAMRSSRALKHSRNTQVN